MLILRFRDQQHRFERAVRHIAIDERKLLLGVKIHAVAHAAHEKLRVFAQRVVGQKSAAELSFHIGELLDARAHERELLLVGAGQHSLGQRMLALTFQCGGKGCRLCKETGWIEVLGAGVVNKKVLENCGIDSNKYSGFAFGLGLERIAMLKYGINNIKMLFESDLRVLDQIDD